MKSFLEHSSTPSYPLLDIELFENSDYIDIMDFDILTEKSVVSPLTPQFWGDVKGVDDKAREKHATKIYNDNIGRINDARTSFSRQLKKTSRKFKDAKVLVDVKAIDSFVEKIVTRGKQASKITDWLRSAILVKTQGDVDNLVIAIKKDFIVQEHEQKDKGGDAVYGYYGSHHFLVKVEGITAEIQIMTKKLWAYKGEAHTVYNKYRADDGSMDKEMKAIELRYSREIFGRGNS